MRLDSDMETLCPKAELIYATKGTPSYAVSTGRSEIEVN
jgi:hypothetical protein